MANPYLLLWLEAPMQSWGSDSKFGRRDTQIFPTKSGIMGLLCSALGAGGPQRELLAEFAMLNQTAISFARSQVKGNILIKQDREPLLRDFHMVGSGYKNGALTEKNPNHDPWESLLIPMTWDLKNKKTGKANNSDGSRGGSKVTYRYYLQDATFALALEVPAGRAQPIAEALQNPTWDVYLGRKNCVPTDFIYRGIFDNEGAALEQANLIALQKSRVEDFRVIHGLSADGSGEVFTLNDVPVQFGEDKRYRDRQVSLINA